ncbi:glycosyltransferase [bacterium]|nr:glycosyltransferase [bacterium]
MKVLVNLVTYNGINFIEKCMDTLTNQTFQNYKIQFLDNGSTDGTADYLNNNYPQVDLIRKDSNIGFAKGHNELLENISEEYVLILNQDIILNDDYLEKCIKFMDNNPDYSVVSGKLFRLINNTKTNIIDSLGLGIKRNWQVINIGEGIDENKIDERLNRNRDVFGVVGTAPIFRVKDLERIKHCDGYYFDEDFFSCKEDVDLAMRMVRRGCKAYLLVDALAYHYRVAKIISKNVWKNRRQKSAFTNYHSYKNHLFVLLKNLSSNLLIKYFPFIFWYEFKKIIYLIFFERKTLFSLKDFFRFLPGMLRKRKIIQQTEVCSCRRIIKWIEQ